LHHHHHHHHHQQQQHRISFIHSFASILSLVGGTYKNKQEPKKMKLLFSLVVVAFGLPFPAYARIKGGHDGNKVCIACHMTPARRAESSSVFIHMQK
jgi:hypothetical protein